MLGLQVTSFKCPNTIIFISSCPPSLPTYKHVLYFLQIQHSLQINCPVKKRTLLLVWLLATEMGLKIHQKIKENSSVGLPTLHVQLLSARTPNYFYCLHNQHNPGYKCIQISGYCKKEKCNTHSFVAQTFKQRK